ncbi:hypothetical protein GE09DRAFT_173532 [Coniochaeta sp. 2T2.1]|nr:hypothetical protein GE09DRAFT_173532 [Coniochaeta sp. 2T2.1]
MAALSMFFTIILVPPVKYSFHCFPLDIAFFICWIVCYALLQDLAGGRSCSSSWFTSYWTVYWSGSGAQAVVTSPGCSQWRVVLGFSFISSCFWFTSGLLKAHVVEEAQDCGRFKESTPTLGTYSSSFRQGDTPINSRRTDWR